MFQLICNVLFTIFLIIKIIINRFI